MSDPIPPGGARRQPRALEPLDQGPREERLLRRRGLQGRRDVALAAGARGARTVRARGHDAAAPAVPLRPRHAELGAPRRRGRRPRPQRRGDRAGAAPGRRGRPVRPRRVHLRRPLRRRRPPRRPPVRRGLRELGRDRLAARPRSLGGDRRPPPAARRHPLRRRDAPVRRDDRRRSARGRPSRALPVLPRPAKPGRGRRPRLVRRSRRRHDRARSRTTGSTTSPRSSAPSRAPACASSTCTSSPSPPRRSSTGWCRTRTAGGGCRPTRAGYRKDLPFTFSLRATRPADEEA